jgi:NADH-quinone oxidoreductase subunit L
MIEYAWLIPLIPALAYPVIGIFGRKLKDDGASYLGIAAIFSVWVISLAIAYQGFFTEHGHHMLGKNFNVNWLPCGSGWVQLGFTVDALTIVMLLVVTTVSLMVQIYSRGYMHGDPRFTRFYSYLSLFTAAMLALVIANNILLMFMSWELVGLTSYLLIGFWFEKPSAMKAAKKAFLVTRVGDLGFFAGIFLLFSESGSLNLTDIFAAVPKMAEKMMVIPAFGWFVALLVGLLAYAVITWNKRDPLRGVVGAVAGAVVFFVLWRVLPLGPWGIPLAAMAGLLLFCGSIGKSAQFPLHVWLPDAMEGPTPVSALIHAATMVAAGVYLIARMYPVFNYTGHPSESISLIVVAVIGAFTAVFAATIGIAQNDIKRVLAYSTVSQLGYMIMAMGIGGPIAGMFHLMTHAYFKANLFLGSGAVIHGTHTQDIREMGGLRRKMPWTTATFIIGTLALAGFPLTAGFFSKDEILLTAYHWEPSKWVFYAGVTGAFLTAFYMMRLVILTFFGDPRDKHIYKHAHENPWVMLGPLVFLSVLSIAAGFVGAPWNNQFAHHLHPLYHGVHHHPFSMMVMLTGTLAGLGGLFCGWLVWGKKILPLKSLEPSFGWLHRAVENKYYFDEIYQGTVIRLLFAVNAVAYWLDRTIVDGIVNGVAWVTNRIFAIGSGIFDRYVVDGLVNLVGAVTQMGGRALRFVQTGVVQQYALFLVMSMLIIGIFYIIR